MLTPKQELDRIISSSDISNIKQIQFIPTDGEMFSSMNENVMKLTLYISNSLGKKIFNPGELKNAFGFIIKNLDSHLSREEYQNIISPIESFITTGGSIEIIEKSHEEMHESIPPKKEILSSGKKVPSSQTLGNWDDIKTQSKIRLEMPSTPIQAPYTTQKMEKVMTWKNVLLAIFVLWPLSGIITSIITYPFSMALYSITTYSTGAIILSIFSFITTPILFVLLSERILKLSRKGSIILFIVSALITIGIFAAVCGGIIYMYF